MSQPIEPEVEPVVVEPIVDDPPTDPPAGLDSEPDPQLAEPGVETPFTGLGIPELENASPEQAAQMYLTAKQGLMSTRKQLDELETAPVEPTDISQDEYYTNPAEANRVMLREELAATVAPILNEMNEGKRERLFDRFRQRYGEDFTALEPLILDMFAGTGAEVTEGTLYAAYTSAIGQRALMTPATTTAAPVNTTRQPVPPHQSPSSPPPPPKPSDRPKELTEEERDLCRLRGITHDEYREEVKEFGEEGPYVVDTGGEAQNG